MQAVEAVKGVHSHTDRANEASRVYGDRNKFEFPLRRASATCEFIYASMREGDDPWRTSRGGKGTRTRRRQKRRTQRREKSWSKGKEISLGSAYLSIFYLDGVYARNVLTFCGCRSHVVLIVKILHIYSSLAFSDRHRFCSLAQDFLRRNVAHLRANSNNLFRWNSRLIKLYKLYNILTVLKDYIL